MMDNRQDQQCSNMTPTNSEQYFSQESDIVTLSDMEYVMDDLGIAHNLNVYFEQPEVTTPLLHITDEKIHNACDSTYKEEIKYCVLNPSSPTGILPCLDNYPGPYDFKLLLEGCTAHKKSWVYSDKLNKVFIDVNKVLLVQFHLNAPASGLQIRAVLVYTMADYLNQPVNRCPLHSLTADPQRQAHSVDGKCYCAQYEWVGHVLQTDNTNAQYDFNPKSERHSVVIPLEQLQAGSDVFLVPYRFTCKTSCNQGINRRPVDVILTLETSQCEVIGRQTFSVKICSCPKRDKEKEEQDAEWFQKDRGVSAHTGKHNKTNYKHLKKLKPYVTTENCVIESHTIDIIKRQDFHEMLKRAEELSNIIQSLMDKIQSFRNTVQSLSDDLKSRQTELTQLLVELGRVAAQKEV